MQLEERKELSVPFGTNWYRCESCELRKRKGEWVFYFSGKVTEYKVDEEGVEIYTDFLNLKIPDEYETWEEHVKARPGNDILDFLQKWGPLGLYYQRFDMYIPDFDDLQGTGTISDQCMEEYWTYYHTRRYGIRKLLQVPPGSDGRDSDLFLIRPESVFDNYFESSINVGNALRFYHHLFEDVEVKKEPFGLNYFIEHSSLQPFLIQTDDKKYKWSFAFNNLIDALIGLHGQTIIGKVRMEECDNCHTRFDAIATKRRRFCSDTCSVRYSNKQMLSNPLLREKRKLQARAGRRGIKEEKVAAIKREISQAKTQKDLKAIEKKYGTILERRKPWGGKS